jgi:hypothetical protein
VEDLVGRTGFHEIAGPVALGDVHAEEGGDVGDPLRLVHVVGHDCDRVVLLQLQHELLDPSSRDGVEGGAGLVHQEHGGLGRDGTGDAQALLLASGQGQAAVLQLVLDLVPERGLAERALDALGHRALEAVQAQPEGDVVEDAHREGVRLLEDHADVAPHRHRIHAPAVHVLALELNVTLEAEAADQVVHPVERPEHRALPAAGGTDEAGDLAPMDLHVAVPDRQERTVVDLFELAVDDDAVRGRATIESSLCVSTRARS